MQTALLFSLLTLALVAQDPAPKTDTPKPETPQVQEAAPAPQAEAPKAEAPKTEVPSAEAAPAPPAEEKKPEAPKVDKVLARMGKAAIRQSDFDQFLSMSMNPQQRMQMEMMGAKAEYQRKFLEYNVIAEKARKEGLDKTPEFKKKMKLMEMQVLLQDIFAGPTGMELQAKVKINDEDVKAFYDKHQDKFKTPESFNARHLLVSIKGSPSAGEDKGLTEEEAKAKIAKAQEDLKAGKSWDEVAKTYSDDPGSKDKGGLYENIAYGSFVPEFEQAVRTQEPGKVGEPVKTKFGYHLIQVEKKNPLALKPFEAVKEEAKQMATDEKRDQVFQDYVSGLKKELAYSESDTPEKATEPAKKTAKKPVKKVNPGAAK
jgi:parvulin-like peptidyl-prolyl isomerase